MMKCIRPNTDNTITQTCQEKDIQAEFDLEASVYCPNEYFVKGVKVNQGSSCGLNCMDREFKLLSI